MFFWGMICGAEGFFQRDKEIYSDDGHPACQWLLGVWR